MHVHRRIRFRHLRTFVEIARRKGLKPAAEALNMTQPAVSKVLKDLEEILGLTLLERDRGGARLTPPGEVFLQFAEQSLAALQHGLNSLEALQSGETSRLQIGALPSVAAKLLPEAVLRFRALSPGTLVVIEEGAHDTLVDRLRGGELDLVVGRLGAPESMAGLSFTQLYSEHVEIVTAAGHPLAGTDRLAEIARWPVLYPPRRAAIRPLVDRLFVAHGIGELPDRIETVSEAFGRVMALGPARAVWIISHGVVAADLAAGTLASLRLDRALTAGPVGIMARSEEVGPPVTRLFRKALIDAGSGLGAPGPGGGRGGGGGENGAIREAAAVQGSRTAK